jgi:general secretion pathway protein D
MATRIGRSWSFIVIIIASLMMGALYSAGWAVQDPERRPSPESVRQQAIERLVSQMQRNQVIPPNPAPGAVTKQAAPAGPPTSPLSDPAPATRTIQRDGQKVTLNFENLDLYEFVNQISTILGLTPVIIDSEVRGSVNLLTSAPMSREDVFPLFNMILKSKGAALIKQGGIYQIVPTSSALKSGVEIIEKLPEPATEDSKTEKPSEKSQGSTKNTIAIPARTRTTEDSTAPRLITYVIRAEFVPVKDLIEPIKLFMTEGGVIMPFERLNWLILTDYSDSAAKVMQLIHMLDNSFLDPDLVELVKVDNNSSEDVVADLKKIFGTGAKESTTGISFLSLDRLNTIFVMASSKRGLEEVKRWIKELDATSGKKFQTFVYVVQNSTASNIAMMISALFGGEDSTSATAENSTAGTQASGGSVGAGRTPQTGGTQGLSSLSSRSNQTGSSSSRFGGQNSQYDNPGYGSGGYGQGGSFGSSQRLGPQLNVSRNITSQILKGGTFSGLQDIVRLVVDDINNSLIIQSTPADYAYISETIKKMDVMPRQAIIDARIFEVDLTDDFSFGVNAELQARTNGNLTTGGLSPNTGMLSGNTFAFVGNSRQILLALDALRTKTKVRILEAPSVLALDGTSASIVVGSEVPYPAGSFTTTSGSTTNVQYRDTGISLLVMPRISASGSVTLDITQEVSSVGASTNIGGGESAPSFTKTQVMTTLSVKDGETVAIAGLIRDKKDVTKAGIPFLSDIPILGSLFGGTTRNAHRTELIILITPHVIRTVEKFQEMTQELKDSLRNVRKLADETETEHIQDMEDARQDRVRKEQMSIRKIKPAKKEKIEEIKKPE